MIVIMVSPDSGDVESKVQVTAGSLEQHRTNCLMVYETESLDRLVDLSWEDPAGGVLLVRAGVRFLREPTFEDFVSPVTGEQYLFSDYPQDWFPLRPSPEARACQQLLFLSRSALTSLPQVAVSAGEVLKTGYLRLHDGGQQFIWREPLIRTITSRQESDALIATGIDSDSQRWGYLGIVNEALSLAAPHSRLDRDKARALGRLSSRKELLHALVLRFQLTVLIRKEPYYRSRRLVGAMMLRVPALRRFVKTD